MFNMVAVAALIDRVVCLVFAMHPFCFRNFMSGGVFLGRDVFLHRKQLKNFKAGDAGHFGIMAQVLHTDHHDVVVRSSTLLATKFCIYF